MKTSVEAKQIFKAVVKNKNFMTPTLVGYKKIKYGAAEITSGEGFSGNTIYGITVVKHGVHNHDLSKCVHSIDEVNEYINSLK